MGSVKDLKVIEAPKQDQLGIGRFLFSDRYSVFDWGEMPDHIPHKGEALCLMTTYFFEKLEQIGIKTHFRGLVENGKIKALNELNGPSNEMEVSLVRVIPPKYENGKYNYSDYANLSNYLVPLEVIYRNTLPEHSSFRKRAEKGEVDITEYGFLELPGFADILDKPVLDVSTKLEATDRYISWEEARQIAGLTSEELEESKRLLLKVNQIISEEVEKAGLQNLDGKIELAFDTQRDFMVIDSIGTPDECRFEYDGFSISKEVIRKYYRKSNWFNAVAKAKEEAGPKWQEEVPGSPEKLPEDILNLVSQLYMTCANEITGQDWFKGVLSFQEIRKELESIVP